MATQTSYPFTQNVNIDRLRLEIQQSSIVTVLDHITTLGTEVDIFFKDVLSSDDQTTLANVVAAHVPTPLPDPTPVVNIGTQPAVTIAASPAPSPFAAKTIGTKKLYKRVNGIQQTLVQGQNIALFTIPYAWAKITGVELIGGETLDTVSLYVLDSIAGTYSTIPNYTLNQFGFNTNIGKDYYKSDSEYDADVYQGMQIKVLYTSISAKTVGVNFILNEVK